MDQPATTPKTGFTAGETEVAQTTEAASPSVQFSGQLLSFDIQTNEGVVYVRTAPSLAEHRFRELAEQWYLDTLLTSSYFEKILHPAYQKILTLNQDAIPLILHELETMPNDWFWALRVLTDADPVTPEMAGDMQAMADAWIARGRDKRYI
jgi:hypothetical protein